MGRKAFSDALDFALARLYEKKGDREYRKTLDEVFDRRTLLVLEKLISNGYFVTLDFPISTGKEGNVFRATTEEGEYIAVKIYRVSTATFKTIGNYVEGDPRFKSFGGNRRRMISLWCSKEYRNLLKLHDAGVRVPRPIRSIENVLLMGYIGDEERPAPLLRDVAGFLEDPEGVFCEVVDDIRRAYMDARLVHADLSEYNILWWKETPWIIDVAQGVVLKHPRAEEFLVRDVKNICRFFRKLGVDVDEEKVLAYVRGGEDWR